MCTQCGENGDMCDVTWGELDQGLLCRTMCCIGGGG